MRTNIFTRSFMTIAISAILAGCSNEEVIYKDEISIHGKELNIIVNDLGFVNNEHTSRVSEDGYKTNFTVGDEIGVYVISGNSVVIKNLKAVKGADGWNIEGLYHYEDADYIAYFPYDEGLTDEDIKSEDDIVNFFDNKFTKDQFSLASYYACDLMTAKVEAEETSETSTVTFNFSHKRSMLEFVVPTYIYKSGNYTYSAPLGLEITIGDEVYNPHPMGNCIYRCIVKPSTLSFSGKFTDAQMNKSVTFGKDNVSLSANGCISYSVKYDNAPSTEPEERLIQVGDYYYADGSICPKEFTTIPTAGCLGVIFSTSTNGEKAKDGVTSCSHGYVLSLYNATGNSGNNLGTWDYYMWDNSTSNNNQDFVSLGLSSVAYAGNNGAVDNALIDDFEGLKYTDIIMNDMKASGEDKLYHAISTYGAEGYATAKFAAPLYTTGWFVPSVGQFVKLVRELGGFTDFDGSKKTNPDVFSNIEGALMRVDGVLDSNTKNGRFWTSNTSNDKKVYLLELKKDENKCQIWTSGIGSKNRVRPILAF